MIFRSTIKGLAGTAALLGVYFGIVTLVSGWSFAISQFSQSWYFVAGLAIGFGIQIGLYSYLKSAVRKGASKSVVAVSGTTSTVAMISCCAHYLTNMLPIVGIAGVITLIGQYQTELFWFGIIANAIGIGYIANRIIKFSKP
ncbi:MAG: hypothetical protein A2939_03530 [Parcubacteria group bacterium RIFCSPLOWO2_01_FULL_48_18]|nr:MAG: hypothetical protein A2939_03530 [Parcubacteria group bacterium RIFCSPLOWO2_01_FULL_48_18]OHB23121.1 MAG: hypothetical protein A3J67_03150 [Parcubacteria group bacterium RIFCSPHIGHO2_02_FULL_48_10b]